MQVSKESRIAIKDWCTIVAIMLGGVWAVWTFCWEQGLKLFLDEPHINAAVTLERALPNDMSTVPDAIPIYLRVELENTGKRTVQVLSGYLTVHADKLKPSPASDFSQTNVAATLDKDKAARSLYWNKRDSKLIFVASAFPQWSLEPGEKSSFMRVTWVPTGQFDQLEANLAVKVVTGEEDICFSHQANDQFDIYSLPGRKQGELCEPLDKNLEAAEEILLKTPTFESTSYLVLSSSRVLFPPNFPASAPSPMGLRQGAKVTANPPAPQAALAPRPSH